MNAADAAWVLLSSGGTPGDVSRFALDLAYVYAAILRSGVQPGQVRFLVDDPTMRLVLLHARVPASAIADVGQAQSVMAALTTSGFLGVVVSGHGGEQAIATRVPIRSADLLGWMAGVNGASTAGLVLGQCYAGVFRYVDARTRPMSIMGATNFESSFSMRVRTRQGTVTPWLANPFLIHFADWLDAPEDVDGDGACTMIDAFRHASVRTMTGLHRIRTDRALRFKEEVLDKRVRWDGESDPRVKSALKGELDGFLDVVFGRAEPWIMGADEARKQRRV